MEKRRRNWTGRDRMDIIGIIPARMASSRLPGKPLAKICGIPMIGHVYHRSALSKTLDGVYIATCDQEIMDYASSIGARAVMTSPFHERASDRTAEAMHAVEKQLGHKADIVVMIQGDEPMLHPEMIDESLRPMLDDPDIEVINLMSSLSTREEHEDPNEVKVVTDLNGFALYFSREPIPSRKKGTADVPMLKQVCIISFRRDFLIRFNELTPTPLEIIESVDMLRVLEHGYRVKMIRTGYSTYSVDTKEDLEFVSKCMQDDPLVKQYAGSYT
jgi:3-deoxy-manno-octulosonate cytidylyltransferase (CMP-KDO synthetase)